MTVKRAKLTTVAGVGATAAGLFVAAGLASGVGAALAQDAAAVVEMTGELTFNPQTVTISAGETVEWRNASGMPHTATGDPGKAADPANVVLPEEAEPFDSEMLSQGESYKHTFDVPGRYQYVCLPHEAAGMIGEIIVE